MVNGKSSKDTPVKESIVDFELEEVIQKRMLLQKSKVIVVGSGIASSHLGDERNLREFLMANTISNYLRQKDRNVLFLLFDDSYDPLNFRQLRVAVNKDEILIRKFKKYCGMPLKLIPDPFGCHRNYSFHYQNEILKRFYSLDVYPNIIDSSSSYESGLYDFAKDIVFTQYKEIDNFLKKEFPKYTMKKIFWPVCPKCSRMEEVYIENIKSGKISIRCSRCGTRPTESWKNIKGKFSWKIDAAVRWNVFKTDFEPFSKAYLDPDVGSYFIAKKLSKEFFGGYYPEIIHYGQVIMDKSLSYKLLASLPKEIFHSLFLMHRKKDITLSDKKILQFAREYKIDDKLSYYDYVVSKLSYDLFELLHGDKVDTHYKKLIDHGLEFARHFLKRELHPKLPKREVFEYVDKQALLEIRKLIKWLISYKMRQVDSSPDELSKKTDAFLIKNKMHKAKLFPLIRKFLSQEHSLPMSKIFYFVPNTFLYGCLSMIVQIISETKKRSVKKGLSNAG